MGRCGDKCMCVVVCLALVPPPGACISVVRLVAAPAECIHLLLSTPHYHTALAYHPYHRNTPLAFPISKVQWSRLSKKVEHQSVNDLCWSRRNSLLSVRERMLSDPVLFTYKLFIRKIKWQITRDLIGGPYSLSLTRIVL